MVTKFSTNTSSQVAIYITGNEASGYRITYEFLENVTDEQAIAIRTRLLKSFSLGRQFVDAKLLSGAQRKANLMKTIFRQEYGLLANTVTLTNERNNAG